MKKTIWIILLLIVSIFTSLGQNINVAKLDSFFNILSAKGLAMGSLAISKNDNIKYQKTIGYSLVSDNRKVAADINTKYRIGSVTKMFTAIMIFQLIEEGKIKLDQKLKKYFSDLPNTDKGELQIKETDNVYHLKKTKWAKLQLTLILPIVGLEIGALSSGNSVVLRFGA